MIKITKDEIRILLYMVVAVAILACLPLLDQGYILSLGLTIVMYVALCTAWVLFSGPTHYISLATAAFFGLGTYVVGIGIDVLPFPILLIIAALIGGVVSGLVGIATLRLSGVYFVIFTLGMAELIRQIVTWIQTNFTTGIGLYVLTDFSEAHIYWMLLALTVLIFITGWLINRSRLGFAMRIIGNDETVAAHVGIDSAKAKVLLFLISGAYIAVIGAILAPRFAYIEPPSAFNPMISFLVVIMSLMGGTRTLWAPLIGVVPFTLLFDMVSARFPNHSSILLGIAFLLIVYLIPDGLIGRIEGITKRFSKKKERTHE
ncbi:branched-chain amino acid ABC transporter permease [Desulfobacula sp.]|uniref:branched-chain amino acid ABC transporter permease n=1 Tax=Desulfobacula sp. TaxID=2593537 RepID=UPI00262C9B46|nr:branched-chain amino acid ABC transporter permease [Desulfobacula sp.]